jgi:hypothetical protein
MEVTRARFGSLLEWAVAALCAFALLIVGSWMLKELHRAPTPIVPVAAEGFDAAVTTVLPPAAVPSRVVSVPIVLLSSGLELRVGESESSAAGKLNASWRAGDDMLERAAGGTRITRAYDDGARKFQIVLDPAADGVERRVSAIYVR